MLGGKKSNARVPVFVDANPLHYAANASDQLQLFGNCESLLI